MGQATRQQTVARHGRTTWTLGAAALCAIVPDTAFAADTTQYGSYGWVWATLASVLVVAAVWLASGTAMRAFIRLRWLPQHLKIRLDRTLNVFFGAMLLMALVVPYLAVTVPAMAIASVGTFLVVSLAAILLRRPASDDDIQFQE